MIVTLPVPRDASDDETYTITLGGVQVRYRIRWWPRLSGWYLRMESASGSLISDWHRIGPEAPATWDVTAPGHPPGRIVVAGVGNGDQRSDLFDALEIQFVPVAP
jgi:hypothetical protein